MRSNDKDLRLIHNLLADEIDTKLSSIAGISNEFTFGASGLNVDYILYLTTDKDGEFVTKEHYIDKFFNEEFEIIGEYQKSGSSEDIKTIIDYIRNTRLIDISRKLSVESEQDSFNYCITLSDRYLPRLIIDIDYKLKKISESISILNRVYLDEIRKNEENNFSTAEEYETAISVIEERYKASRVEIKYEVCNYFSLWIHAYRFLKARKDLLRQPNIIAFSHRYQGWSKPIYKVNNKLEIEFKTNFGYGDSSYFYLLLIYKGIKIFPFLDWTKYKYAQASKMEKYTFRYHEKDRDNKTKNDRPTSKITVDIQQNDWKKAMQDLVEACNISRLSDELFINRYITTSLDILVEKLEEIIDSDDKKVNEEYRDFDFDFDVKNISKNEVKAIKLMNVKGALISGTLDFISHITKLSVFIDSNKYVNKIEELNYKILPFLQKTIIDCKKLNNNLNSKISGLKDELGYIWLDEGLKDYQDKDRKGELDKEMEFTFFELKARHLKLSKKKNIAEQELQHIKRILRSIERYIESIESYFQNSCKT